MMKKLLAILLCVLLLATMVPLGAMSVSAGNVTLHQALQWLKDSVDHQRGNGQCVGLTMAYYEFLGVPVYHGNANTYSFAPEAVPDGYGWTSIPGATPQAGDIMVWTKGWYDCGHVAICGGPGVYYHQNYGGTQTVRVISQSWTDVPLPVGGGHPDAIYWGVIRPNFFAIPDGLITNEYRAHCQVKVSKACTVKSLPCSPSTNANSVDVEDASKNATYEAIGLVKNNQGNLWYKVNLKKGGTGYLYAGNTDTSNVTQLTNDVTLTGVVAPSTINKGSDFAIGGTIKAKYQTLAEPAAWVNDSKGAFAIGQSEKKEVTEYSLRDSKIDKDMRFDSLSAGTYTYCVAAMAKTYYAKSATETATKTSFVELHSSTFTVGVHTHTYNEYVYNWAAHPHYACYKCTCGEIVVNYDQPHYAASCGECNTGSFASITEGVYFLRCRGNGNYLNVANGYDYNCNGIHTYQYGGWTSQMYEIKKKSDGYEIRPLCSSNRVVNPYSNWVSAGDTVNLYDRTDEYSQWWKFEAVGNGFVIRSSQNPNVCLTPGNEWMVVSQYTGSTYQIWDLEKACTISFDIRGGSGGPSSVVTREGYATALPVEKPTKACYNFFGWTTETNATWPLYQPTEHFTVYSDTTLYAVWENPVHTYSDCADTTCNTCGGTRTAPGHVYSNGCDSTCNTCGATRGSLSHTYDNACDASCNVCGASRTPSGHVYSNSCDSTCNVCGASRGTLTHTYDDEYDADCNVCGYVREIATNDFEFVITDGTVTITGYKGNRQDVIIPAKIKGYPVTSIGKRAFRDQDIVSVTLPDSVTTIGDFAFSGCQYLSSVDVGDGVISIGIYAFSICYNLASVDLGSKVQCIGESAFWSCDKLTSITLPDSMKIIGSSAFRECDLLSEVNIPDGVTDIGEYAFFITAITAVHIPDAVTVVGARAFSNCHNLSSVTIGQNVTHIGDYAFGGCDSLNSVTIPQSVISIGEGSFSECASLSSIIVETGNPNYCSSEGVLFDKNKTELISCPAGKSGAFVIPNTVVTIGSASFSGCVGLSFVTIPTSVTSIGKSAFSGCKGLRTLTIPDSVTSIGKLGFADCSGLTAITLPNKLDIIELGLFTGCTSLYAIVIPNDVTSIQDRAFIGCESLTSVTLGDKVASICFATFGGCNNLTDVFYGGTQEQANEIRIYDTNPMLLNAAWHYNYQATPSVLPGDVNADGKINNKDLGLLQQYLNDWDVSIVEKAADTNGDGKLNNKDLGLLQQYLNEWDVTLG